MTSSNGKHFPCNWPFVRGIHRSPVNSPHKSQWRDALMFSLIYVWINGWENNREAGDLRRYRAHYDVAVMRCHCVDCILCATRRHIWTPSNGMSGEDSRCRIQQQWIVHTHTVYLVKPLTIRKMPWKCPRWAFIHIPKEDMMLNYAPGGFCW